MVITFTIARPGWENALRWGMKVQLDWHNCNYGLVFYTTKFLPLLLQVYRDNFTKNVSQNINIVATNKQAPFSVCSMEAV